MKTFIEYCAENKKELPVYTEKQLRTGIAHWAYPDGYVRGEYPSLYWTPIMADAIQKMGPKADDSKVDTGKFTYTNFLKTKE